MTAVPFFKKMHGTTFVRLHADLYKQQAIEYIQKEEPEIVKGFTKKKGYYLVELRARDRECCFNFINYVIYRMRNQ